MIVEAFGTGLREASTRGSGICGWCHTSTNLLVEATCDKNPLTRPIGRVQRMCTPTDICTVKKKGKQNIYIYIYIKREGKKKKRMYTTTYVKDTYYDGAPPFDHIE